MYHPCCVREVSRVVIQGFTCVAFWYMMKSCVAQFGLMCLVQSAATPCDSAKNTKTQVASSYYTALSAIQGNNKTGDTAAKKKQTALENTFQSNFEEVHTPPCPTQQVRAAQSNSQYPAREQPHRVLLQRSTRAPLTQELLPHVPAKHTHTHTHTQHPPLVLWYDCTHTSESVRRAC